MNVRLHVISLLVLCLLASAGAAAPKVIYVKPAGLDLNDGSTWTKAKKTVQAGLLAAAGDDEVWVAAGTYTGNVTLKADVALYGGFAGTEVMRDQRNWRTNRTVLDGGGSGSVVTVPPGAGASTRIDGFTIRNGKGTARVISGETFYYGGGVYCRGASPTIINNLITGCDTPHLGGGVYTEDCSPAIRNNVIIANTAGWNGAGIYIHGMSPSVLNNIIAGNTVTGAGTGGPQGGGIYIGAGSSPKVIANTIARNSTPATQTNGGGICSVTQSGCTIANNIIAHNSSGIYSPTAVTEHHNCVAKNTYFDFQGIDEGDADLLRDPLFVDAQAGNYHVQAASPCLDTGLDSAVQSPGDWKDIDGQGRIRGLHVDIGADELWPPSVAIDYPTAEPTYSTMAQNLSIAGTASEGTTQVTWQNDRGGSGYCLGATAWSASTIVLKPGQNLITITARDDGGFASTDTLTVTYNTGALANVVYVRPDGNDSDDGSSWPAAKRTIQGGINEAVAGEEVWVAAGTYRENVTLKDGVAVYGGFAGGESSRGDRRFARNVTTIDGGGAGNAVRVSGALRENTRIDGFTIRNGTASASGGIYCYSSYATIANCVIRNNGTAAGHGAGIHINGGGVTVTGCVVAANSASNGNGGGIYCFGCGGETTITNNTIANNSAKQGGGIYAYNCQSQMVIANNIVASNSSGIHRYGTSPALSRNNVYSNGGSNYTGNIVPGAGDVSENPEFVDQANRDYHIKSSSPCVDNGSNSARGLPDCDMDGQSRLRGMVDIGADEFWPQATVQITSPTADASFLTDLSSVNLGGSASEGVLSVTWSTDRGASGSCVGLANWTADGVPLSVGANTITVTADGVTSTAQDVLVVYRDSAPPQVTITSPTTEPGYTTSTAMLSIGGTASDDTGVTLVAWANSRGGNGVCVGTSQWTATGIALLPGTNLITVAATDAAGKTATAQLNVTFSDSTAPVVAITDPTSAPTYATNATKVTIAGTATDDVGVQSVAWSSSRGGSGTCTGAASWNAPDVPLLPGQNVITVTAVDASGNAASDTVTISQDAVAPVVSISEPTADETYATTNAKLDLTGTASDDTGVTSIAWANDRGGSGDCIGTAPWNAQAVALQPGVNNVTVTARDAAGNTATDSLKVTFTDVTGPVVTIAAPTSEATYATNSSDVILSGTALDDVGVVSVYWSNNRGGSGTCAGLGNWSVANIPLLVGANIITITASDAAGNTGTDAITVTFTDNTAPAVTITSPTSDDACGRTCASISLGGTASDDAGVVSLVWSNDQGGSGDCAGTSSWSASGIALQPGRNVITVSAYDASGNGSTDTLTIDCDTSLSPGDAWKGLAMVSVPMLPDAADPLIAIGFQGSYWVAYQPDNGYTRYPDRSTWFEPVSATPGRGFWTYFDASPAAPCGTIIGQDRPFSVTLRTGWNLVGHPFTRPVEWDADRLLVREPGVAERPLRSARDTVAIYGWGWNTDGQEYYLVSDPSVVPDAAGVLEPWKAYWVRAYKECELVIPAPE